MPPKKRPPRREPGPTWDGLAALGVTAPLDASAEPLAQQLAALLLARLRAAESRGYDGLAGAYVPPVLYVPVTFLPSEWNAPKCRDRDGVKEAVMPTADLLDGLGAVESERERHHWRLDARGPCPERALAEGRTCGGGPADFWGVLGTNGRHCGLVRSDAGGPLLFSCKTHAEDRAGQMRRRGWEAAAVRVRCRFEVLRDGEAAQEADPMNSRAEKATA